MNQPWYERFDQAIHDNKNIKGFFGEYRFLSNYEKCLVEYEGIIYTSSEAAFQAAKTLDPMERLRISKMEPSESKKAGRQVQLRKDWESVKLQIMETILTDKFTRNPEFRQKLLDTENKYLEETNWWKDQYWGVCDYVGQNWLGQILMKIREKLK